MLKSVKGYVRQKIVNAVGGHVPILKYHPEAYGQRSFAIATHPNYANEGTDDGLNVPPRPFWIGYGDTFGDKGREWYLSKGKSHTDRMLQIVEASGLSIAPGSRFLDLGCAAGRMIRHLKRFADHSEIWGCDINAPLINWCTTNLSPPFHFATTTTIPHLPFEDGYFDLIYTGSVFTHIDDLAEAWLLEIRRVLSNRGRAYITIHDRHTIKLLDDGYYYDRTGYFTDKNLKETELTNTLNSDPIYQSQKNDFGKLVIGRDYRSQVFYDIDYFSKMASQMFDIASVTEEAYGHQTAVLLAKKALK
jgi:ubiquinone/menaquinone biosynthesis C-methylase UbiE